MLFRLARRVLGFVPLSNRPSWTEWDYFGVFGHGLVGFTQSQRSVGILGAYGGAGTHIGLPCTVWMPNNDRADMTVFEGAGTMRSAPSH